MMPNRAAFTSHPMPDLCSDQVGVGAGNLIGEQVVKAEDQHGG